MGKMIRDKVVGYIEKDNKTPITSKVEGVEYAIALWAKLREEYNELEEAITKQMGREDILEEIADVITVLEAISRNVFNANIASVIELKLDKCGGFEEGIILDRVQR